MVIETVDILLIVADISLRSVETAATISKSADKFTRYKQLGVILNKVRGDIEFLLKKLDDLNLPLMAEIPEDENIVQFDSKGKPLIDLPEKSPSLLSVHKLVKQILDGTE